MAKNQFFCLFKIVPAQWFKALLLSVDVFSVCKEQEKTL